ncbi:MAG: helix-turn-helix domain-containing protein [Acidimicrobiales bacterium]
MARLRDVRRWTSPEDPEVYSKAYAEAELAEDLGTLVHDLRVAAGLGRAELAVRMGVGEDEVLRAEEGDASLGIAFYDGVARAVAVRQPGPPSQPAAPTGWSPSPQPEP